jgi:AcrR family transcriptional regulator
MERRRKAILAAARDMLEREPLSMRRLAEAAGVSQATPYNLFGTKRRIFLALYQELNDDLLARIKASDARDALDRMYAAIRLMTESLAAEPGLFRALIAVIYASDAENADMGTADPAVAIWTEMMTALRDEGLIDPSVDTNAFTRNFVYLLGGALMDWTDGRIDADDLEAATRYGFTLAALAVATDGSRARLQRVLTTGANPR